jgi:hypothetical protein
MFCVVKATFGLLINFTKAEESFLEHFVNLKRFDSNSGNSSSLKIKMIVN